MKVINLLKKWSVFFILTMFLQGILVAYPVNHESSTEKISLSLNSMEIYSFKKWNNVSIDLEYQLKEPSDALYSNLVKEHVHHFLEEYSVNRSWWEVVNANLVYSLIERFPEITNLKSRFALTADQRFILPRASIVEYDEGVKNLTESFYILRSDYPVQSDFFGTVDIHLTWTMKPNPTAKDHPDYRWIEEIMSDYFRENPLGLHEWQETKVRLEELILNKFPKIAGVQIQLVIPS